MSSQDKKTMVRICNRTIEYSFYALFFLVPLVFASNTSELFELNKMWLTWILTIIIGASWFVKMVLQRRIYIQKTPLDTPIVFFLISQIISTIFSLDTHVSIWGYYSRFNGGLLSILSYVFLYYAFLSNFDSQKLSAITHKLLAISLISGLIVALWGLPSHFGYDPTCFLFRGTLDVSCWTADFQPRARIFSTLGQPAWLAAYLAILIPISIALFLNILQPQTSTSKKYRVLSIMYYVTNRTFILTAFYILLTTLFYVDLLFTQARSGILGLWLSLILFFLSYIWTQRKRLQSAMRTMLILTTIFFILTFVIDTPIAKLNKLTLPGLKAHFVKTTDPNVSEKTPIQDQNSAVSPQQTVGGTKSADIRLLVWQGSINAWKNNPLFGTGVETFAYAYYKYKPVGQNLTSEWNFLYNKAHNEYLNYLTTTGLFGLITYLSMIVFFLFLSVKQIFKSRLGELENRSIRNLILALIAAYISILITNFFGFSVVITNIYLFMIPAFVLILGGMISENETKPTKINYDTSIWQWTPIFFIGIAGLYMLIMLFRFWKADISYALGANLNKAGEYQEAYRNLHKALSLRGNEPVFKDELAVNDAMLAVAILNDKNKKEDPRILSAATNLVQEAITINDQITSENPNNIVFWKSKVRLFFTLSRIDARYLAKALDAIEKASILAPNDANISYNLGVLYGQNNKLWQGVKVLEKTVALKPDYTDAYYALGLFYRSLSTDEKGEVVIDKALNQKAIEQMQYILTHISPNNALAKDAIKNWERQ